MDFVAYVSPRKITCSLGQVTMKLLAWPEIISSGFQVESENGISDSGDIRIKSEVRLRSDSRWTILGSGQVEPVF